MRRILILCLWAASLFAADATGTWTGSLLVPGPNGEQAHPAHLVLKQEGAKLTGTAGPSAEEQYAIEKGTAEEDRLTFEVPKEGHMMKSALKLEGDQMSGMVLREREGVKESARLEVKRSR